MEKVKLKSFLGTTQAPADTEQRENYWQLIGKSGEIIDANENHDGRVLVLFDNNLDDYDLESHNPVKNSLWIRLSDLAIEG
ncbi:hypothetical protein [Hymenobacter metallicola]|uniref:Uncharacterized protein n=1 Tax=Hymenobacter metallicola TaxID=2563114 RepID=A0A4Z0QCZ5_9BACT|nr:hypothetical protein [Hymenobacter metallicola]TGE27033.1 hypothetical protein E5K02_11550 [Hymenobacter metallicola]